MRLLLAAALAISCNGSGGPGGVWDVPEVDRQIILAWLHCTDCIDGELDKVAAKGTRLAPYLSAALLEGPTKAEDSLANMRAQESALRVNRYRSRRGGRGAPLALTPAESVNVIRSQSDAFRLKYRLRAAQALSRIDSARAADDVGAFCRADPPELQRNPQYRTSFKAIGSCP